MQTDTDNPAISSPQQLNPDASQNRADLAVRGDVMLFLPAFESGGVERNAVYFANGMVENGFGVCLLYCRSTPEWFSRLDGRVRKVRIAARLRTTLLPARVVDAVNMLWARSEIARVRSAGPAAIVSFQSNVVAIVLARSCRTPVAVRISNHYDSVAIEGSWLRGLAEISKRLLYRFADVVFANSAELAADYARLLRRSIGTIPNPIDLDEVAVLADAAVADEPFVHKRQPIIVSAGRLVPQKNFPLLLQAVARVVQLEPCQLVILGEGSERNNLERLVGELQLQGVVHLPGNRPNVYRYFRRSDLFVLSSSYEGMPNAVIEAIACGLPVVATRCKTGPAEILCNGDGGRLVPINDSEQMAEAILRSLTDKDDTVQRQQVALQGLHRYERAKVIRQYVAMVQGMLAPDLNRSAS